MIGAELTFFAELRSASCQGAELDQHSARQMPFSEAPPARRRAGRADVEAITADRVRACCSAAKIPDDVPVLDARHYLEEQLDMHNAHQSFVVRERIRRAGWVTWTTTLIWFLDARPEEDDEATSAALHGGLPS